MALDEHAVETADRGPAQPKCCRTKSATENVLCVVRINEIGRAARPSPGSRRRYASSVCRMPEVLVPRIRRSRCGPYRARGRRHAREKSSCAQAQRAPADCCGNRNRPPGQAGCTSSTPATSPTQVSRSTVSKAQGASPPRSSRNAARVAANPHPRQVVAVKWEIQSEFRGNLPICMKRDGGDGAWSSNGRPAELVANWAGPRERSDNQPASPPSTTARRLHRPRRAGGWRAWSR